MQITILIRLCYLNLYQIVNERLDTPDNNTLARPNLAETILIWLILKSINWWSRGGSNSRPPACKAGALPAELRPLSFERFPFSQTTSSQK
jgi:hypothetical protein